MRADSVVLLPTLMFAVGAPALAAAQDLNILLPPDSVEYLLARGDFALPDRLPGTRFEEDRTQRVSLWYDEITGVLVKWALAPRGGEEFNNNPRYEIAAYELQKLFLDESEYVVPPTVPRMVPLEWYRTVDPDVEQTFHHGRSVLVVLQYFLFRVTDEDVFDEARFDADSVYARHWGDANLLTYLIAHKDSNTGNLLISTDPDSPRVFAVDNGVSFRSEVSRRGTRWSELQVERFPRRAAERLQSLTEEDLQRALGVLAEFELQGDELVRVAPTENWQPRRGIREKDSGVQIGLTDGEIEDVWGRVRGFLMGVDRGWIQVFP